MRLALQQRIEASHDDSVWTAHWSPTENILATGSVDESVKLWQDGAEGLEQRHQLVSWLGLPFRLGLLGPRRGRPGRMSPRVLELPWLP